jgi:hypothetical protein
MSITTSSIHRNQIEHMEFRIQHARRILEKQGYTSPAFCKPHISWEQWVDKFADNATKWFHCGRAFAINKAETDTRVRELYEACMWPWNAAREMFANGGDE